jgi:CRP-like cAMP-binding protein
MKPKRSSDKIETRAATHDALLRNKILAALPPADLRRLSASAEIARLSFGQVLYRQGESRRYVYFPIDGYISLISSLAGFPRLEVGLVGVEGMVGTSFLFGVEVAPLHTVVQGAGSALRLGSAQFVRELARSSALREILQRYLYVRFCQLGQTAACTRFHNVEARLARWLLLTRDRAHSDTFRMTQVYMAFMLGVRRVGVTEAASELQKRNLIRYTRGAISIVSKRGLEGASCECYATAERIYARHMH